jgi:hypothetical protein
MLCITTPYHVRPDTSEAASTFPVAGKRLNPLCHKVVDDKTEMKYSTGKSLTNTINCPQILFGMIFASDTLL